MTTRANLRPFMFTEEDVETLLDLRALTVAVEQAEVGGGAAAANAMERRRRMRMLVERLLTEIDAARPLKGRG